MRASLVLAVHLQAALTWAGSTQILSFLGSSLANVGFLLACFAHLSAELCIFSVLSCKYFFRV